MHSNIALSLAAIATTLASSFSAQAQFANSGNLTAEVSSLRNETGQVCFSLFDSSKGFPNDKESIVETKCVSAALSADSDAAETAAQSGETQSVETQSGETQGAETQGAETQSVETQGAETQGAEAEGSLSVTFESLPLGTYAVSVFHDENEDGQINQGGFGIPLEGFGFSQNPAITTRAPEFSETAIIVVGAETKTEIELIYY